MKVKNMIFDLLVEHVDDLELIDKKLKQLVNKKKKSSIVPIFFMIVEELYKQNVNNSNISNFVDVVDKLLKNLKIYIKEIDDAVDRVWTEGSEYTVYKSIRNYKIKVQLIEELDKWQTKVLKNE